MNLFMTAGILNICKMLCERTVQTGLAKWITIRPCNGCPGHGWIRRVHLVASYQGEHTLLKVAPALGVDGNASS